MDKVEARRLLTQRLEELRRLSYEQLQGLDPRTEEIEGPSGTRYQIEVQSFPDDKRKGTLRVMASIDDGGRRSFVPLSDDFIVAPDGTFVGE